MGKLYDINTLKLSLLTEKYSWSFWYKAAFPNLIMIFPDKTFIYKFMVEVFMIDKCFSIFLCKTLYFAFCTYLIFLLPLCSCCLLTFSHEPLDFLLLWHAVLHIFLASIHIVINVCKLVAEWVKPETFLKLFNWHWDFELVTKVH